MTASKTLSEFSPFSEDGLNGLNPFFYISFFEKSKEGVETKFNESDIDRAIILKNGKLQLKPDTEYTIRIHHYFLNTETRPRRVEKRMFLNLGNVVEKDENKIDLFIDSQYDVKEIVLRTSSSVYSQEHKINLYLENVDENSKRARFCDMDIPTSIEAATVKAAIHAVAIGVGVSIPAIIGGTFRPEFGIGPALESGPK